MHLLIPILGYVALTILVLVVVGVRELVMRKQFSKGKHDRHG